MIMTFIAVGTESIKNFVFHSLIKNVDMMIIRSNQFYFYSLKFQSHCLSGLTITTETTSSVLRPSIRVKPPNNKSSESLDILIQ